MTKNEQRFNIGKVVESPENKLKKIILPLYLDVKGLENANALAQYALYNRDNMTDLIAIFPAYEKGPSLIDRGKYLDKIYGGSINE